MTSTRHLLAGFLVLIGLTGAAWFFSQAMQPKPLSHAMLLPESRPLVDFELLDEQGSPFRKAEVRGNWHLLFFGFTHCPDICPATLQQLAIARQRLAAQGSPLPDIILVSVDPERDSPAALASYTKRFGDGVRGVTGSLPELRKLAGTFGVYCEKEPGIDDDYSVNHSAVVLVINPQAEFHALFSAPQNIDNLVHDLPLLMRR